MNKTSTITLEVKSAISDLTSFITSLKANSYSLPVETVQPVECDPTYAPQQILIPDGSEPSLLHGCTTNGRGSDFFQVRFTGKSGNGVKCGGFPKASHILSLLRSSLPD